MPNSAYLDGQYFDPETKRIMGVAFEIARAALRLAGQDDFAPETIARKIIELAKAGERDPEQLCDRAMIALRGRRR
jgi:hypothetical protein